MSPATRSQLSQPPGEQARGSSAQSTFDADRYRREKTVRLEHQVRMLEAELRRHRRLLAMALRVATSDGRDCSPLVLLDVLCGVLGIDPARPAWVEEDERKTDLGRSAP